MFVLFFCATSFASGAFLYGFFFSRTILEGEDPGGKGATL